MSCLKFRNENIEPGFESSDAVVKRVQVQVKVCLAVLASTALLCHGGIKFDRNFEDGFVEFGKAVADSARWDNAVFRGTYCWRVKVCPLIDYSNNSMPFLRPTKAAQGCHLLDCTACKSKGQRHAQKKIWAHCFELHLSSHLPEGVECSNYVIFKFSRATDHWICNCLLQILWIFGAMPAEYSKMQSPVLENLQNLAMQQDREACTKAALSWR